MSSKERRADRTSREALHQLRTIGTELREARLAANLSQATVGRAAGVSHPLVSRLERGDHVNVPLTRIHAVASVLGLRLSVRVYPVGSPLRDAGQLALLERLRSRLHPHLGWRTEVALPIAQDLRAWDASISGPGWVCYVDAETRIRDVQALARRTMLKKRDTATERVILLIADTRANRAVLRALGTPLIAEPLDSRATLAGLARGQDPAGSAVILL